MNLPKFSVDKPVTITMMVLIIVVFGVISFTRLGLDMLPDIEFPVVSVITSYPGVASKDIEDVLTKPIEDAVATVCRELRQETGYLPRKVERLGGFYSAPGYSTEYLYLYLATDLTPSPLYAEDTESIKLTRVPVSQISNLITSGAICDAKSIAGLLAFLEYQKTH